MFYYVQWLNMRRGGRYLVVIAHDVEHKYTPGIIPGPNDDAAMHVNLATKMIEVVL